MSDGWMGRSVDTRGRCGTLVIKSQMIVILDPGVVQAFWRCKWIVTEDCTAGQKRWGAWSAPSTHTGIHEGWCCPCWSWGHLPVSTGPITPVQFRQRRRLFSQNWSLWSRNTLGNHSWVWMCVSKTTGPVTMSRCICGGRYEMSVLMRGMWGSNDVMHVCFEGWMGGSVKTCWWGRCFQSVLVLCRGSIWYVHRDFRCWSDSQAVVTLFILMMSPTLERCGWSWGRGWRTWTLAVVTVHSRPVVLSGTPSSLSTTRAVVVIIVVLRGVIRVWWWCVGLAFGFWCGRWERRWRCGCRWIQWFDGLSPAGLILVVGKVFLMLESQSFCLWYERFLFILSQNSDSDKKSDDRFYQMKQRVVKLTSIVFQESYSTLRYEDEDTVRPTFDVPLVPRPGHHNKCYVMSVFES